MAYKILRSVVVDNGSDPDAAVDRASVDLGTQVETAEAGGWKVAGGVQVFSRLKGHGPHAGLMIWLMQAMERDGGDRAEAMRDFIEREKIKLAAKMDANPDVAAAEATIAKGAQAMMEQVIAESPAASAARAVAARKSK